MVSYLFPKVALSLFAILSSSTFVSAKHTSASNAANISNNDAPNRNLVAVRMLQAYAASLEHVNYTSLLLDAKTVLGDCGFNDNDLEEMVKVALAVGPVSLPSQSSTSPTHNRKDDARSIQDVAPRDNKYADRHLLAMEKTTKDFDCMEREFDASTDDYDNDEVIRVLEKCRLVVVRNVFNMDSIQAYTSELGDYLGGLHTGRVSRKGRTTHGQGSFYHERSHKRWEVLLPRYLASKEIIANNEIMAILQDKRILSESMMVHSAGAVLAESGATAGHWHTDDEALFGDDHSLNVNGIAGHDLPMHAISMMTPMLNLKYNHGPTEFCMGTSHLTGMSSEPTVMDDTLIDEGSPFQKLLRFREANACPPDAWRVPLIGISDMILFDYQIEHRGGANQSPDLRVIHYTTYSRSWYRDSNFDETIFHDVLKNEGSESFHKLIGSTRFAIPDKVESCKGNGCSPMERIAHFIVDDQRSTDWWYASNDTSFAMSNKDLDVDNLAIFVNDKIVDVLPVGQTRRLSGARVGAKLDIRNFVNGHIYKVWTIGHMQRQIIVSMSISMNG